MSVESVAKQIGETFHRLELSRQWLEEQGSVLDPNIEAREYRALAKKMFILVTAKEVIEIHKELLEKLND